jgi:hypothetical protein
METLGSLVDKLTVVNLKIYHTEDIAHDPASGIEEVGRAKLKINVLNNQRNALIEEIDVLIEKAIESGEAPKVFRTLKDYGPKK